MTDDEILAAAARIQRRRLEERRLEGFEKQVDVMIRWDNRGDKTLESYTGITIPAHRVADIVREYFAARIEENATCTTPN